MEEFTTQVEISFELNTEEIVLNILDYIDSQIDDKLPDFVDVCDLDDDFKKSIYKRITEKMEQTL